MGDRLTKAKLDSSKNVKLAKRR